MSPDSAFLILFVWGLQLPARRLHWVQSSAQGPEDLWGNEGAIPGRCCQLQHHHERPGNTTMPCFKVTRWRMPQTSSLSRSLVISSMRHSTLVIKTNNAAEALTLSPVCSWHLLFGSFCMSNSMMFTFSSCWLSKTQQQLGFRTLLVPFGWLCWILSFIFFLLFPNTYPSNIRVISVH